MRKALLLFTVCLSAEIAAMAQNEPKVVVVSQAGTLAELLGDEAYTVTAIEVQGVMNAEDFKILRDAGNQGVLESVNLAGVEVEGNVIPPYALASSLNFATPPSNLREVVLPDNITEIGEYALYRLGFLQEIVLPSQLKSIGDRAFENCVNLGSITWPEGLERIGAEAFYDNAKLTHITFPESLKYIGAQAFSVNLALTSVDFPAGLEEIDVLAFNRTALKSVVLPEGLIWLGFGTFMANYELESIEINSKLTALPHDFAFLCESLKSITIPGNVEWIGENAFSRSGLTELTLSEGVRNIGVNAFSGCRIETLVLPASITELEDGCFSNAVTGDIFCKATVPPICDDASVFEGLYEHRLFIPEGTWVQYHSADVWDQFVHVAEHGMASVNEVGADSAATITTKNGCVSITGAEGQTYAIYTADGRCVAQGVATAETTVPLPAGLYIVKAGATSAKVTF